MKSEPPILLAVIDDFLDDSGMSPVTFGRTVMKDPHFIRDLRNGRRVWPETEAKVRSFMASYRSPTPQQAEAA